MYFVIDFLLYTFPIQNIIRILLKFIINNMYASYMYQKTYKL